MFGTTPPGKKDPRSQLEFIDNGNKKYWDLSYSQKTRKKYGNRCQVKYPMFDGTMVPTVPQGHFIANPKNNNRLITILINKFASAKMKCKKADENADCLIVNLCLW